MQICDVGELGYSEPTLGQVSQEWTVVMSTDLTLTGSPSSDKSHSQIQ
jgi:hypothetical protein